MKIGIVGGGQLGKMLIQSALDLDLEIVVLENDLNCPCASICSEFVKGDILDFDAVYNFGLKCDVVTIEIENVNIEALKKLENEGIRVYPQPHILENIKNKIAQKRFLEESDIPTASFIEVHDLAEIKNNIDFLPAVNKIAVGGYDGKGVQVLKNGSDVPKAFDAPGILEKLIDFEKELAVIVARRPNGEMKAFPVVEMVFHPDANLVEYLFSPAQILPEIEAKSIEIATKVAEKYGIVGLLAVELFLTKEGEILVNEVAPRPHNSGHQTQKANFTSQFDQHIRAICDFPLGNTENILPSAMVNLLGEENHSGEVFYQGLNKILAIDNIYPFFYGKKETKPFRKMGHVTILEQNFEKLKEKVKFVKENLFVISK